MIALTMLIIVGVGTLFVIHHARQSVLEEVRSSVDMALQLVDAGLNRSEGRQPELMAWLAKLAQMEKIRHLRIHIRKSPQSTIDLSQGAPGQALSVPVWFAWAVTPASTVGEKLVPGDGEPVRIFIEANPADEISEAWTEARSFLIFMVALAAAVSALVHITLGRAFKSVSHILRGMEDIEQGDYGKRLPHFEPLEFDRISAAFNRMASKLEKSRDDNQALTRHSLQLQEEERRYLAQELHDEFGQSLSAIKAMAASLRNASDEGAKSNTLNAIAGEMRVGNNLKADAEPAQIIMDQCDRLFGVVRGMMRSLHPLMLEELGLIPSLQDMLENWRARHPEIDLRFILDNDVEEFVGSAKIHLFRIVQEGLTNISKHAEARNVRVGVILTEDDCIDMEVSDDGKGFDPTSPRTGFGLHGIHERLASIDGVLTVQTAPGQGVSLKIKIPCDMIKP